jgi:hypothetical protein
MKKLFIIASLFAFIVISVKAQTTDVFDSESMNNVVENVKAKALAALDAKDEDACILVIAKVRRFYEEVNLAGNPSSPEKAKEVRGVLVTLDTALGTVKDKLEELHDKKEIRIEQLSSNHSTGTVYGIDVTEARGMVIAQLNSDMSGLGSTMKKANELDKKLKEKIQSLDN